MAESLESTRILQKPSGEYHHLIGAAILSGGFCDTGILLKQHHQQERYPLYSFGSGMRCIDILRAAGLYDALFHAAAQHH